MTPSTQPSSNLPLGLGHIGGLGLGDTDEKEPVLTPRELWNRTAPYRNNHKILTIVASAKEDYKRDSQGCNPGKSDLESSHTIATRISNMFSPCNVQP